MTRPTLTVELGYLSGWTLGTSLLGTDTYLATVSFDQDISDLVRSVSIRRGRQHELNRVEAGTASVMVLNQDGAMTRIPPMTAIRIRATLPEGFAPSDIVGLVGWYDLSLVSTLWQDTARTVPVTADGDVIKGVTDRSGNGKHLSEATNGPTYKTAIINGESIARFDGTNDTLASPAMAGGTATIFVVAQKRSAPDGNFRAVFGVTDNNALLYTRSSDHATQYIWRLNQAAANVPVGGTATNVTAAVMRINSAASMDFYMNGGTATNLNPDDSADDTDPYGWGGSGNTGANFGDYDLAEGIVYSSALSAADINLIGAYLADKWGFTWTAV